MVFDVAFDDGGTVFVVFDDVFDDDDVCGKSGGEEDSRVSSWCHSGSLSSYTTTSSSSSSSSISSSFSTFSTFSPFSSSFSTFCPSCVVGSDSSF